MPGCNPHLHVELVNFLEEGPDAVLASTIVQKDESGAACGQEAVHNLTVEAVDRLQVSVTQETEAIIHIRLEPWRQRDA